MEWAFLRADAAGDVYSVNLTNEQLSVASADRKDLRRKVEAESSSDRERRSFLSRQERRSFVTINSSWEEACEWRHRYSRPSQVFEGLSEDGSSPDRERSRFSSRQKRRSFVNRNGKGNSPPAEQPFGQRKDDLGIPGEGAGTPDCHKFSRNQVNATHTFRPSVPLNPKGSNSTRQPPTTSTWEELCKRNLVKMTPEEFLFNWRFSYIRKI